MRVVLDTVVLVRGLIGPYSRWGRLLFERRDDYRWIVSEEIVAEYLRVLGHPELARRFRAAGERDLRTTLELIGKALIVQPVPAENVCRDPGDEKFLSAAVAGDARFIVSEDNDLLTLESHQDIRICTADEFLRHLDHDRGFPGEAPS